MPTKIGWTEETWNPVTGCTKISPGCKNCYAEKMSKRLKAMGLEKYKDGFQATTHDGEKWNPLKWKKSKMVFVCSMSDLFHEAVPFMFMYGIFETMSLTKRHTFQLLTKRSETLLGLDKYLIWPNNIWMGVSVENKDYVNRIDDLRKTSAKIKFLSLEPLLGPIPNLNLDGIDWVIVGGESGPGFRPIDDNWVRDIRDRCIKGNIPFYFKQRSGFHPKKDCELDGKTYKEFPIY